MRLVRKYDCDKLFSTSGEMNSSERRITALIHVVLKNLNMSKTSGEGMNISLEAVNYVLDVLLDV
jgi:hypothetical protein